MHNFILRRLMYMIPTLIIISIIAFIIIQLPPGDFMSTVASQLAEEGVHDPQVLEAMRARYGLDQPLYVQYYRWVSRIIFRGDFGHSFQWNRPVAELIWNRLGLTFVLMLSTMIFIWVVAFPIGVYSALRQYSILDYVFTLIGFIGLATPNFMLALIMMYIGFVHFGQNVGGLFSAEYIDASWSWGKFVDMLRHLWIPIVVLGTAGTAGLIRIMRANMLDELDKLYVVAARARGIPERRLIIKYPLRVAINPFVSTIGWILPQLASGATITAIVLSLPTTGPMLYDALLSQDMYLAGSFILMLSFLTVIGTLISDLLLAWLDPRIRYD